eukprot:TRINITY_DN78355_c0_g1_i2.p1 TRINITY_DN78355_c0_g1~~TRINITY_DN78355_c0_g1_i2.p1  ORF type:complete len:255 (-),score=58.13 TRINITY_DN78355_c0_g1_i2:46-810(-)
MAGDPCPDADRAAPPMASSWAMQASGDWAFSAQFFVVSAPPGSGKTAFLERCAAKLRERGLRVGGVLAPNSNESGRRQLVLLENPDQTLTLQLNDGKPGDGGGCADDSEQVLEGTVKVGNFIFSEEAFTQARATLQCLRGEERGRASAPADWVLIDEVGPLELNRGQGLEPAVGELLRAGARGELGPPPSLRDTLVQTYGLDGTGMPQDDGEGLFPGFGGPEARAAAVVHLDVPAEGDETDALIDRFAGLPPLL